MKKVRLGNIVKIRTGKLDANAASENGEYPFFTCAVAPLRIDSYQYDCECVLVAGNGDLNVKYYNGKFDAYQRTYIIESLDHEKLAVPYLYLFLDKYVETLRQQAIGGVIKYIKLGNLTEASLPLPPLEEQFRITCIFDKVNDLIDKRHLQLEKLDLLVKSQFFEMFGENDYPICRLKDECEIITKGTTPTTIGYNFTGSGVNFIKIENIDSAGHFDTSKMMYISEECNSAMKRSQLQAGDLLFSIAGAIGRCAIVPEELLPANTNQALAIIRIKKSSNLINGFLFAAVQSGYISNQYLDKKRGVAQLNLSLKDIGEFTIPIPPVKQQMDFISIANQADKSKFEVHWDFVRSATKII